MGTDRRPIAIQVEGRTYVGPDNGLLSWVVGEVDAARIVVLDRPQFWLPTVSSTFHGRDVFGPVVAHLACAVRPSWLGTPTESMVTVPFPAPHIDKDAADQIQAATGEIVHVDRYGNLISNVRASDLPTDPVISVNNEKIVGLAAHFQSAASGRLIALIGSAGLLEIAVPNGSAASLLGLGVGAMVTVSQGE